MIKMDKSLWAGLLAAFFCGVAAVFVVLMLEKGTAPIYAYVMFVGAVVGFFVISGYSAFRCHNTYNEQNISWQTIYRNRLEDLKAVIKAFMAFLKWFFTVIKEIGTWLKNLVFRKKE